MGPVGRAWARFRGVEAADAHPTVTTTTPKPAELDELGQSQTDISALFQLKVPDPQHIALITLVCHEVSSAMKAIRLKVWRAPLKIVPAYHLKCLLCGTTTDTDVEACPNPECFAPRDMMRAPDDDGHEILEKWKQAANLDGQSLEALGEDLEDDGNAHDALVAVFRFEYTLDQGGVIQQSVLKEVRRGDPRIFRPVKDNRGRRGGRWYACLTCRAKGATYKAEDAPGPCKTCKRATYEVWYVETTGPDSGQPTAYYLKSEIVDESLHYNGSSPLARLWDKAVAILWMDKYVWMAFDPRRDKRADKILAIIGGQADAIEKWAKNDAEKRRRNPYRMGTIHLPILSSGAEARPDVKVIDLGEDEIKHQSPEIYARNVRAIWREYGVSPADMGDLSDAGGLNNEGLQLRVSSQTVEHHMRKHQAWLDRVAKAVGVEDWRFEFEEALEEQESIDADTLQKYLEVAERASKLGLTVRWVENRPHIADGEITAPAPPPSPFGAPQFPRMPGDDAPDDGTTPGQAPPAVAPNAGDAGQDARVEQAHLPRNDRELDTTVRSILGGKGARVTDPGLRQGRGSGAAAARDAVFDRAFAGLAPETSQRVKEEIIQSLTQPQGWSTDSIVRRIQPILEAAGVDNASARAETIARTEVGAITSEWKLRVIQAQETEDRAGKYVVVGADDFRTTKLSRWIRQTVGDEGRPLRDVLDIMDQGIRLAKAGAFTEQGMHASVEGDPIRLPADFTRRGFVCHYNERDTVVRRTGGDS